MPLALTTVFADRPDPRIETANKLHKLVDILVIATCAVDYEGRLTAHLPMATRLLMVKATAPSRSTPTTGRTSR